MFLSSGNVVATIDASAKALGNVIVEYIAKGFTGRITYRDASSRVFISIEMIRGVIQVCRATERGSVFEGGECERVASNYLYVPNGSIEVVEIGEREILRDIIHFPYSVVSEKRGLVVLLQSRLGAASKRVEPAPAPAPPPPTTPQIQSTQVQPSPTPIAQAQPSSARQEVVAEAKVEKVVAEVEMPISNECIDPLTLYTIVKNGAVQSVSEEISYQDIIKRVGNIVKSVKAKQVYLSANIQDGVTRIVVDVEKNVVYMEFEDSRGNVFCGEGAVKEIGNRKLSNVKMWIFG